MRTAAIITFGAAICAMPAAALSPPWPVCDNADGTRSEFMLLQSKTGEPAVRTFQIPVAGDPSGDLTTEVIVHCPSRKALSWTRGDVTDASHDALTGMLNNDAPVTLKQMQRKLRRVGLKTTYGTLSAGNCACDETSYYPSF